MNELRDRYIIQIYLIENCLARVLRPKLNEQKELKADGCWIDLLILILILILIGVFNCNRFIILLS